MKVSRREYLKIASAIGASAVLELYYPEMIKEVEAATAKQKISICWLQGAGCTGCSISFLNAERPDVVQAILKLSIGLVNPPIYHPNVMPSAGFKVPDETKSVGPYYNADEILEKIFVEYKGDVNILVVEGAVQEAFGGHACFVHEKTFIDWVKDKATRADYVVAFGSCSSFGGIASAEPNPTEASGLQFKGEEKGGILGAGFASKAGLPVVNLPGCPSHPDWITLTLVSVVLGVVPELDEYQRPKAFYGSLIHENCPRRAYFQEGKFVPCEELGKMGCLLTVGCKGPVTHSDCPLRLWNAGMNFPIAAGAPCFGCVEPGFPDKMSPFYSMVLEKLPEEVRSEYNAAITPPKAPAILPPAPSAVELAAIIAAAAIPPAAAGYAVKRKIRGKKEGGGK